MNKQILPKSLWEPIFDQGIPNTNFFNGRVLTADDLQTEQKANRSQHQRLGQAAGAGVVCGLEVTLISNGSDGNAPVVNVTSGLALNVSGQTIAMPLDVRVALQETAQPLPVEPAVFKNCLPPQRSFSPITAGVYLLIAFPASGFSDEKVPMCNSIEGRKAAGCGNRYAMEGVQFRLEQLDVSSLSDLSQSTRDAIAQLMTGKDPASLSKLRNWLAHICFGMEELAGVSRDPFKQAGGESAYVSHGALDALHPDTLTNCDVPLALLYWPAGGIKFVDLWSVRRTPIGSPSIQVPWNVYLADRRAHEAEAMFLQFEEHLEWLLNDPQFSAANILADPYFRYLPPVGLLPVKRGAFKGIDLNSFFEERPLRKAEHIDPPVVYSLLKEVVNYEPIDLSIAQTTMWLYRTWLGSASVAKDAILTAASLNQEVFTKSRTAAGLEKLGSLETPARQPIEQLQRGRLYVVFTSPYMPHAGAARFDLARFDQDAFTGHDN